MSPLGCARCGTGLLAALVAVCDLCGQPHCPDCLRGVGDGHPDGLRPGVYCRTCLGDDRADARAQAREERAE